MSASRRTTTRLGLLLAAICLTVPAHSQEVSKVPSGTIRGRVTDALMGGPVAACSVYVDGQPIGILTSDSGEFQLEGVDTGTVVLVAERVGYERHSEIRRLAPAQELTVHLPLIQITIRGPQIVVVGEAGLSSTSKSAVPEFRLNAQQIRHDAGSVADLGRSLLTLPSTSRVQDNASDLIVRGGSPIENAFYVDDIPIPNINHFPVQGSTSGAVTMFGSDLVSDVSFQPGGFSAAYEDALSSVVDVKLREGTQSNLQGSVDANLIGVSGVAEGAIAEGRGSWLFGARRSHVDLLTQAVNTPEVPAFVDTQGKLVYNLSPSHSFTLLNLFGDSRITLTRDRAYEMSRGEYGDFRAIQSVSGMRWRWLWGANGAATTTLSYSRSGVSSGTGWTRSGVEYYSNRSDDRQVTVRSAAIRIVGSHSLETGLVLGRMRATEDFATAHYYAADGEDILPISFEKSLWQTTAGAFLSDTWSPSDRFSLTLGTRLDYAALSGRVDWSPRASARWKIHRRLSLHGAAGWYHQNAPSFLLLQLDDPGSLSALAGTHELMGLRWEPLRWANLSLDLYAKQYSRFPLDATRPYVFVVDDATSISGFIYYPGLDDDGRALAKGIELLAELRPISTLSATLAMSLADTRYRDGLGQWHERSFNTGQLLHVSVNYNPSPAWRLNARWSYSGGGAFTPFDRQRSTLMGRGVPAPSRINSANLPEYHALHAQVERRWAMHSSTIAAYLGVMNAYDRNNVAYYYWDYDQDTAKPQYQWGIMPVIGLRYEF